MNHIIPSFYAEKVDDGFGIVDVIKSNGGTVGGVALLPAPHHPSMPNRVLQGMQRPSLKVLKPSSESDACLILFQFLVCFVFKGIICLINLIPMSLCLSVASVSCKRSLFYYMAPETLSWLCQYLYYNI